MPVEAADDGNKVHAVLNGIGVGCGLLLYRISTICDCDCGSIRHGMVSEEECEVDPESKRV